MTNHPFYDRFREFSWRRKLTPAEEAELSTWLQSHPELRAQWEAEMGLTEALRRMPDAPLSSNFTSQVLAAVEREGRPVTGAAQSKLWEWRVWLGWLPRKLAFGAVILIAGVMSYHHFQDAHRAELVRSVKTLSEVAAMPDILQDFDAIQRLAAAPQADEELLKLLQ